MKKLINKITEKTKIHKFLVSRIIKAIPGVLKELLDEDSIVKWRGVGTIQVKYSPSKMIKSNLTKNVHSSKEKMKLTISPSGVLEHKIKLRRTERRGK